MGIVIGVSAASSGLFPPQRPDFPPAGVRRGGDVPSVPIARNDIQADPAVSTDAPRTPATQSGRRTRPVTGNDPQAEVQQPESESEPQLKKARQEEARRAEAEKKAEREEAQEAEARKADARKEAEKEKEQTEEARRKVLAENIQRKFGDILQAQSRLEFIGKHANLTA